MANIHKFLWKEKNDSECRAKSPEGRARNHTESLPRNNCALIKEWQTAF